MIADINRYLTTSLYCKFKKNRTKKIKKKNKKKQRNKLLLLFFCSDNHQLQHNPLVNCCSICSYYLGKSHNTYAVRTGDSFGSYGAHSKPREVILAPAATRCCGCCCVAMVMMTSVIARTTVVTHYRLILIRTRWVRFYARYLSVYLVVIIPQI